MNEKRFKTAFQVVDRRAGVVAEELPLLSVSQYRGVVPRSELMGDEGRAADLGNYKVCDPGDIVLNRMSAYNGAVGLANLRGVVSPDYLVMRPNVGYDGRYLTYLIRSAWFVSEMSRRVKGIGSIDSGAVRTPRIGAAELGDIRVRLPCLSQQQVVVDFLDRETAQIDAFIAKNEELITLLTERRSALVAHAVTKGLDPLADLKEGGVEWLGRVPSHWRVSRLSRWFSVTLGKMLDDTKNQASGGDLLPYVRAANIRPRALDLTSVNEMPFTALERKKFQLQRGDLLVVEGGSIGVNAVLDEDMPGWGFQKTVNRVRPRRRDSAAFLGLQLDVMREAGGMEMLANVSTILHFTAEKLERTLIAMPPPEEQRDITEHVAARTEPIDNAIDRSRRAIDLARERRAALISAAVTGKIDVGVSA